MMTTQTELTVYCIVNVSSPPVPLNRRKETGAFYCHLAVPIQDQLVIFCEGDWETSDYTVTLTYKDDEIELGRITDTNRCLFWKRAGNTIPESMSSETEKGLAKLLLERSEVAIQVVGMETAAAISNTNLKEINENTPQIMEKSDSTPDRPQKKRKSSVNKDEKTPTGQLSKKQKTEKVQARIRTPKQENKLKSKDTPKSEKRSNKPESNTCTTKKTERSSVGKSETKHKDLTTKVEKIEKGFSPKLEKKSKIEKVFSPKLEKTSKIEKVFSPKLEKTSKIEKVFSPKLDKTSKIEKVFSPKLVKKSKIEKVFSPKLVKKSKIEKVFSPKLEKKSNKSDIITSKKAEKVQIAVNGKNSSPKSIKSSKGNGSKENKLTPRSNIEQNARDKSEKPDHVNKKQNEKPAKRKSEGKKKTDGVEETEAKVKRIRKNKKENQNDSLLNGDELEKSSNDLNVDNTCINVDKENVEVDSNIPAPETNLKSEVLQQSPKKEVNTRNPTISATGKCATCKDVTLRALDRPTGRWGHSLCFVNKQVSVLIGGQGDKQQISKDSVWTLDCETRRWKDPPTEVEGQNPQYRMGHTATYDPLVRCIYVYGGSKNTRWFHDVHILDVDEWKWQLVKVDGKAPTRAYHSATLYRHELWIFGGVYPRPDPQPDGCSNEVHIFSPVMESWYSPIVSGEKPIPRSGHSATLLNDRLVIFGGWDAPISYNDLHVLDMSVVEWCSPKVTGAPPSPRSWHASCAISGNRLLIHGGYNGDFALDDTHIFNLDQLSWTRIHVENRPSARVGHKALCMPYRHDYEEEDEIIIFGGGDNDGAYFSDMYSIYVPFKPATVTSST